MIYKTTYLPIGGICSATQALKDALIRTESYCFDWTWSSFKSITYILDNGCDGLLEDYEVINDFNPRRIYDTNYNIIFAHETDNIDSVKENFIRRYDKLIKDIKLSNIIVLVQDPKALNVGIVEHFEIMKLHIKSKKFHLTLDSIDIIKNSILKINPNIKIIEFPIEEKYDELVTSLKGYRKSIL